MARRATTLGLANSYALALMALAALGASGLVFQTSTQALMLRLSPLEYHGRLQSMVILGFSGFGLAALPLGLLADAVTLRWTFVGMGLVIGLITNVRASSDSSIEICLASAAGPDDSTAPIGHR